MRNRVAVVVFVLSVLAGSSAGAADVPAAEYARHLNALGDLSVAVAQTMPAEKYGFKPHPESMNFGELMVHIATTNYQFCAGLRDSKTPALPKPGDKDGIVRFLGDSFQYCSGVINELTDQQLAASHDSPDGHMPGRDILLAMYIHVAHHRGQAEIYLRDEGIRPPRYHI